eukprot:Nk52_evm27s2568 gene=Nk52_evmTU27s2568
MDLGEAYAICASFDSLYSSMMAGRSNSVGQEGITSNTKATEETCNATKGQQGEEALSGPPSPVDVLKGKDNKENSYKGTGGGHDYMGEEGGLGEMQSDASGSGGEEVASPAVAFRRCQSLKDAVKKEKGSKMQKMRAVTKSGKLVGGSRKEDLINRPKKRECETRKKRLKVETETVETDTAEAHVEKEQTLVYEINFMFYRTQCPLRTRIYSFQDGKKARNMGKAYRELKGKQARSSWPTLIRPTVELQRRMDLEGNVHWSTGILKKVDLDKLYMRIGAMRLQNDKRKGKKERKIYKANRKRKKKTGWCSGSDSDFEESSDGLQSKGGVSSKERVKSCRGEDASADTGAPVFLQRNVRSFFRYWKVE